MAKGPPSLIYFALSVLIPAAFRRHVRDLAGLAVCLGISLVPVVLWARAVYQPDSAIEWTVQMLRTGDRLQAWTYLSNKAVFLAGVVAATLPWVAIGLLPWLVRQAAPGARDLWRVLLIYAAAGTVVVALAIETSARYALPAAPALAAAAGLVFDRLRSGARRTARVLAVIVVAASIGRVCYVTWVVPWRAEAHSEYRSAAAAIALALPGNEILYKYAGGKYSLVYYLDRPVVEVDICQLAALPDGAIALFDAQAFPPAPPLWFEKIAETAIGDSDRRVIVARMKRPPPRSGPDSAVR
jgi:hypothetical protein